MLERLLFVVVLRIHVVGLEGVVEDLDGESRKKRSGEGLIGMWRAGGRKGGVGLRYAC